MDAAAYLRGLGWRGTGHSLDTSDRGLSKPLSIPHKVDVLGVGKQRTQVADQWWLRAFDEGLKQLGTGNRTTLSSIQQSGINRGGLYGFFVKGQPLHGTVEDKFPPSTKHVIEPIEAGTSRTIAAPAHMRSTSAGANSVAMGVPAATASDLRDKKRKRDFEFDSGLGASGSDRSLRSRKKAKKEEDKEVRLLGHGERKAKRAQDARLNAIAKRNEKIAAGTFDQEADAKRKEKKELNKRVNDIISKRAAQGEFGTHPSVMNSTQYKRVQKKAKKAAHKAAAKAALDGESKHTKGGIHGIVNGDTVPERAAMLGGAYPEPSTKEKMTYKAERYEREKAKRGAKRELKIRLWLEMNPGQELPPQLISKAERKKVKRQIRESTKDERAAKLVIKRKEEKPAKKERRRAERREAREQHQTERIESRAKTAEAFAKTKTEKKQSHNQEVEGRKLRSQQEPQETKVEPVKEFDFNDPIPAPVQINPTKDVESRKSLRFSGKEKRKYAARATEKGMCVEDYLERRGRKKAAKHAEDVAGGAGEG